MKDYYCLDLKFKDKSLSDSIHHAHLYIKNEEIFIEIFENKESPNADRKYTNSENALSFFDENFEIVKSNYRLIFDGSRIQQVKTFHFKETNKYFVIYLTSICIIKENLNKEVFNEGKVYLDTNGLKVVNEFYSFFTNFQNKNIFEIGRMEGMEDFYSCGNLKFRPELEFYANDRRNSEEFTIKRIPIINYSFQDQNYESAKEKLDIICKFLSFCFGIRINYTNLHYKAPDEIFYYSNYERLGHNYNSNFASIFSFLKENYRIEKILHTNWFKHYISNRKKLDKAIENYLHSREVDSSSKYLLLFNIIEIFNLKQDIEKFELNELHEENFKKALELIEATLVDKNEIDLLRDKWKWSTNKLILKPMKSPLEETLKQNGIEVERFGFNFKSLKDVRDRLTHGSVSSIKEEKLKEYTYAIGKISICLILSQLGFKSDLKNDF